MTTTITLVSAAAVAGSYTVAAGQSVNLATKTITAPVSGDRQFYRIQAGTSIPITSLTVSGANVVVIYK